MIDMISHILNEYNLYMKEIFGEQEFLISTFTMALFGLIGVIVRYVPSFLIYQIKKHLTVSVRIDSTQESYHNIMGNLFDKKLIYKSRFFNIRNGRWGYDMTQLQLGEGMQFFIINKIPVLVSVDSKEVRDDIVYSVHFTTFVGFGKKLINVLLNSAKIDRHELDKIKIIKIEKDRNEIIYQKRESLSNKVLTKSAKKVIEIIEKFIENESYYRNKGLSYKTGILLHGVPGTGKTSLIRTIASEFDMDIYLIKSVFDLEKALYFDSSNNKTRLIVIEELDSYSIDRESIEKNSNKLGDLVAETNLNELLQNLDGIIQADNVIIMGTTNYIEKIDKAIIRPGRFDHLIEFSYIDEDEFNDFLDFYYGRNLKNFDIKIKKTTPAELQKEFLSGLSFEEYIKKFVVNFDEIFCKIKLKEQTKYETVERDFR